GNGEAGKTGSARSDWGANGSILARVCADNTRRPVNLSLGQGVKTRSRLVGRLNDWRCQRRWSMNHVPIERGPVRKALLTVNVQHWRVLVEAVGCGPKVELLAGTKHRAEV